MPIPTRPRMTVRSGRAPSYSRGARWPAWLLLAIPFLLAMIPLWRATWRKVEWTSCMLMVLAFEAVMMVVEHNSIMRGHWVYNDARILGPKIWGIPIEEPLIYYFFPPIFVVLLFTLIAGLVDGTVRFQPPRSTPGMRRPR